MKILFASHGSLGDLVPFLEVGKVLVAMGHAAVVATHAAHRGTVEGAGLGFAPMRPDRPSDPVFHSRFMHPRRGPAFVYREFLGPRIAESDADLLAAARDADVLVSVTLALAAPLVAARTGMAWRSAAFQPAMLYSAIDPPRLPLLPLLPGRPVFNAWLYGRAKKGIASWAEPLVAYRRAQGLGEYLDHPSFGGQHAPGGVVALDSPLFGPVPADAPPGTVQTGQPLQTGGGELDPRIADFLAAGEPPVVFTLGSASSWSARRFFADSAAMARRLGVRALLLVGRAANLDGLPRDPRILAVPTAPYQAVFPRAALVVNQGGIGTIALGLAAGVQQVLVPFAHDQPDNAARAARTGAAVVVPPWRYALAGRTIARALADDAMGRAARAAAETLAAERGAERAAVAILDAA